jgi:hypothetical protein
MVRNPTPTAKIEPKAPKIVFGYIGSGFSTCAAALGPFLALGRDQEGPNAADMAEGLGVAMRSR